MARLPSAGLSPARDLHAGDGGRERGIPAANLCRIQTTTNLSTNKATYQAEIEAPVEVAPAPAKARRRARKDSRTRLTVRVEADTYLQLKLVSAHRRDSLQKVLTKAVEFYLDEVSPSVCEKKCACLESGLNFC